MDFTTPPFHKKDYFILNAINLINVIYLFIIIDSENTIKVKGITGSALVLSHPNKINTLLQFPQGNPQTKNCKRLLFFTIQEIIPTLPFYFFSHSHHLQVQL